MNDKEAIFKRKSIRKFDMNPLDKGTLDKLHEFLKNIKPLFANIKVSYEILTVKSASVKAPHYLAIFSENKDNYLINAGFMFQQFDLFLTENGLGGCWVGMGKPDASKDNMEYVIMIAFGKAADSSTRNADEFNRKTLSEISNDRDERLEAARLAPSSMNSQPWRFICDKNKLHVYCVKLGVLKNIFLKKFNMVDIGIMLCHLYVMDKGNFKLEILPTHPELNGSNYTCSLSGW